MHGIQSGISTMTVVVIGVILSILGAARSVLKPTVAYGPIWMAGALLMVGYLLILAPGASFTIQVGGGTLSIQFGAIFLLLAIVPLLRAVAAGIDHLGGCLPPGRAAPGGLPALISERSRL